MRAVSRRRGADERGSVVPLAAVLAVAIGGLVIGVGRVGVEVVTTSRASSAADAAALAGAADGRQAAERLAAANGAVLVTFEAEGREVQVTVRVGGAEAVARAAAVEPPVTTAASVGLTAEVRSALAAAEVALGRTVPVTSGWRSPAAQQALWDRRAANPYPVARPGTSAHERGEAVDVSLAVADELAAVGPSVGLCRPLPATDPVHFELCRVRRAG